MLKSFLVNVDVMVAMVRVEEKVEILAIEDSLLSVDIVFKAVKDIAKITAE